jgi:hypothetical protein
MMSDLGKKIALLVIVGSMFSSTANAATVTLLEGGISGGAAGVISAYQPTSIDFDTTFGTFSASPGSVLFTSGVSSLAAAPYGDTTGYASVGSNATPQTATLTLAAPATYFGLYWGSVDTYNTITFLDSSNNTIASFTGSQILDPANGFQGNGGSTYANFFFSGDEVSKVQFNSTAVAFEFDNIASGVPEASTWAMMILGFLGLGFLGYRKSSGSSNPTFRMA